MKIRNTYEKVSKDSNSIKIRAVVPMQLFVEVTESVTESRDLSVLCSVVLLHKRSFMAILRVCLSDTRRHFMLPYKYETSRSD